MNKKQLIDLIGKTFTKYGLKTATKTDKNKSAYVVNKDQKEVFCLMGIDPDSNGRQDIKELFTNKIMTVSYYSSKREGSGRQPEIRMGLSDVINYFNVGDEILLATDEKDIFIYNLSKLDNKIFENDEAEEKIYSQLDVTILENKLQNTNTSPTLTQRNINIYQRNNALRAFVKVRANYSCEMPSCDYVGFEKEDSEKYIEVHHLTPLSEGGEDSKFNTVALCPTCHRKMHYAKGKEELRTLLKKYLKELYLPTKN